MKFPSPTYEQPERASSAEKGARPALDTSPEAVRLASYVVANRESSEAIAASDFDLPDAADAPSFTPAENLEQKLGSDSLAAGFREIMPVIKGALEVFEEHLDIQTDVTNRYITHLIESEREIQDRIERDVRLLLKTRKARMAHEASLAIFNNSDDEIIDLLQTDPLNVAAEAVTITRDGATTPSGTRIPLVTDEQPEANSRRRPSGAKKTSTQAHPAEG